MAAQAGHGFLGALLNASPDRQALYNADPPGTKVVLEAPDLESLYRAYDRMRGLPCFLVTDSGHKLPPHFDGQPIVTALGFGPATRPEAHRITKHFRSYP